MEPAPNNFRKSDLLKNKSFLISLLFLTSISAFTSLQLNQPHITPKQEVKYAVKTPETKVEIQNPNVLGAFRASQRPQIFITDTNGLAYGVGLIPIATTDEPSIEIASYELSGTATISLYKAGLEDLLKYLNHDADIKQIQYNLNTETLQFVTTINQEITAGFDKQSKILLPLSDYGIWYLTLKIGKVSTNSFVIRSKFGAILEEGDNEFIFWAQDYNSKRSVKEGSLKLYSLLNSTQLIGTTAFDTTGIAKIPITKGTDIAVAQIQDDVAIVPVNLQYINGYYHSQTFSPKTKQTKYFIFTDRPLYRPDDTIYFKAIIRDDDDANYTIPKGMANAKLYRNWDEKNPVYEKNLDVSQDGTVNGEIKLTETAQTGDYQLKVSLLDSNTQGSYFWMSNVVNFSVQYFRKPDYFIEVTTPGAEFISGDQTNFKISGSYFSGQPISNQKVSYKIYSSDFYEYEYFTSFPTTISNNYKYGYWGGKKILEGSEVFGKNGEVNISLNTRLSGNNGKSQIYSIEATLDDGSGNPAFSRKNILIYAGDYGIFREDGIYSSKVGRLYNMKLRLNAYRNSGVSNTKLLAKIHRENWVAFQEKDKKYPSYRKEEEDLPTIESVTDGSGRSLLAVIPEKVGLYRITVEGTDVRQNSISKVFYLWSSKEDQPVYVETGERELKITPNKSKYMPDEVAELTIYSKIPDRDILLLMERGRVNRFQVVSMQGQTVTMNVPIKDSDIPNIYGKVLSFSNTYLNSDSINLSVSTDIKKLNVKITPNKQSYGPGETVTLDVRTEDAAGNPVSGESAVWAVDKSLFELVDKRPGGIFETFWSERSDDTQQSHSLEGITVIPAAEMGGCFAEDTPILMADGSYKNIKDIKPGDYILTRNSVLDNGLVSAKVKSTHSKETDGYLIINQKIKVTLNHMILINSVWREAGKVTIGDYLYGVNGTKVLVNSLEWQAGKFTVYNLEVEKHHTYFASGILTHNDKGSPNRTVFKDTAYWNPYVKTDDTGQSQVKFILPDNLTTWVIAAIGTTNDTEVGETATEIKVSKDFVISPILPNILRLGDKVTVSALLHNFKDADGTFDTDLKFDSGEIKQATLSAISIAKRGFEQVYFEIEPNKENNQANLVFSMRESNKKGSADSVLQTIPVVPFGFSEKRAENAEGAKNYSVNLSKESDKEKSEVTLSLSSTLIGTLPTSMKYLINYPYGCVEQTTSRLIPAIIARNNPEIFKEILKSADIDKIIKSGLKRLTDLQNPDGGWGWWDSSDSSPFVTAYVFEYLVDLKQKGTEVDANTLSRSKGYLENKTYYEKNSYQPLNYSLADTIVKNYAISLLEPDKVQSAGTLESLPPDILPFAVMLNINKGDINPDTNGLTLLIRLAKNQGDSIFWEKGSKEHFGSTTASTALSIRTLLKSDTNPDIVSKAVRYLMKNKNGEYFANTFATAQVIRAIVDFAKSSRELSPNYTYSVLLDGNEIASGIANHNSPLSTEIEIPVSKIKVDGSTATLIKTGTGQIYSTLIINEFKTDQSAQQLNHGLNVERYYANSRGPQYSLSVGDMVDVQISVSGLKDDENYGVIDDELPSGLIPINTSFKNEQYIPMTFQDGVGNQVITKNGMIMSLYSMNPGTQIYNYKARVVSVGRFVVPPASVSLMYSPEVYGRSEVQIVETTAEPKIVATQAIKKFAQVIQNKGVGSSRTPVLLVGTSVLLFLTFAALSLTKKFLR